MRKHSSPSRPEDEPRSLSDNIASPAASTAPSSAAAALPILPATQKTKRHGFTSAKFDRSASDTLDRRKAEKGAPAAPNQQHLISRRDDRVRERAVERKQTGTGVAGPGSPSGEKMEDGEWPRRQYRSPWKSSMLVLVTALLSTALLFAIVHSFLTRQLDPKGCQMCGMWPAYAKLDGFDTEHTRFASKYSLYLYREATVNEDTTVRGVPVLFITGNAGSYRQVRPIAAEAAHYFAENLQADTVAHEKGMRNLDFFTADFNEDITAFHGQTLLDQAEYLNEAVAYILSLYHDPNRPRRAPGEPDPSSVIVVGHSMGGIVARTMLLIPNYQSNSINTIITMSTPQSRAPVSFDADIIRIYRDVNDYWRRSYSQKQANDNPLRHVTLISIAGGGLDTTVPSDYSSVSSLVPETHGFTVFTSSIPNVWTGSDHLSILWCDQLRKVIVRAILDIVDVRRATQTKTRAERMRVFKHWFLTGLESTAEKSLASTQPTTLLTLEDESNVILRDGERLILRQLGSGDRMTTYLLPVPPIHGRSDQEFQLLTDQSLDRPIESRAVDVFFCSVFPLHPGHSGAIFSMDMDHSGPSSGPTRLACKTATRDAILLPASTRMSKQAFEDARPFSFLHYELNELSEYQYVAIVDRNESPHNGWLLADFAGTAASHREVDASLGQILFNGLHATLPAERPLATELQISAVHSSLLAYKLRLGTQPCGSSGQLFMPMLRQHVSAPFESKWVVNLKEAQVNLHGEAPYMPPPLVTSSGGRGLALQLWSDMSCNSSLELSLKIDVLGSLGKLVMRYRTVFPAIPLVIIALVLRKQFMVHDLEGHFMTFPEALHLCLRSSLPTLLLAMTVFSLSLSDSTKSIKHGAMSTGTLTGFNTTDLAQFGRNELLLGSQDRFFWFLIPLFGFIGVGICVWIHYAALLALHALSLIGRLGSYLRFERGPDSRKQSITPVTTSTLRRRLTIVLILLLMVSTVIPYQFAYMVACIVQLVTCTRALIALQAMHSQLQKDFSNYSHSILILMLCVLPINIPVFIVWVHNLDVHWLTPFSSHHNVLSIMPFVVLVETLTSGTMIPRVTSRFRHVTNILFFFLAVYAALYGVSFTYQLHHLANAICAWLMLVHFTVDGWSLGQLASVIGGGTEDASRLKKRP